MLILTEKNLEPLRKEGLLTEQRPCNIKNDQLKNLISFLVWFQLTFKMKHLSNYELDRQIRINFNQKQINTDWYKKLVTR